MTDINAIPIKQLPRLLGSLSPEERVQAKARLKAVNDADFEAQADAWLKNQMPSNMKEAYAVCIPMHRGEPTVGSVTFMSQRVTGYRKLVPGEVVAVDMKWPEARAALAARQIELTSDPVTRPLVYPSKFYADATRPAARVRMKASDPSGAAAVDRMEREIVLEINDQLTRAKRPRRAEAVDDIVDRQADQIEVRSTPVDEVEPAEPQPQDARTSGLARKPRS